MVTTLTDARHVTIGIIDYFLPGNSNHGSNNFHKVSQWLHYAWLTQSKLTKPFICILCYLLHLYSILFFADYAKTGDQNIIVLPFRWIIVYISY